MPEAERKRTYFILFVVNFLITFAFGINDSLFSLYMGEIKAGGFIIGLAFTLYSLSKISLSPLAGKLLDRHGAFRIIFSGLILYLLVSIAYYATNDKNLILIVRIMQGSACALFRPVMHYVLGSNAETGKRGKTLGTFDLSFYLALATAPVFGGIIKEYFGFSVIFIIMLICTLSAILLVLFIKNRLTISYRSDKKITSPRHTQPEQLKALYVYIFFKGWAVTSMAMLLPIYMHLIGYKESYIGLTLGLATAATAFSLPITGHLADKARKEIMLSAGGVMSGLLLIVIFSAESMDSFIVSSCMYGFVNAISQPACSSMLIESAQGNALGRSIGRFNSIMGIGASSGALVSSVLYSCSGIFTAVCLSSALSIFGGAFVMHSTSTLLQQETRKNALIR
ncbi:major facilitator superfamily MFS_1 [Denitrovibrio acetiphilus DSM 12809]|uniref:Major facilitator superfamily MFS_1 n=1 Tax=Denitrovibrio acetiphilus (strain DSM 12809 / NBRC 114555 / N2460) TaxID=522772 RepID=D4H8J9_DENA2|nr:MFS transporter [Denitrovibrio acetiphilus]ADD68348.1 major facilitator superfamily MFS_1 [Denitrovibrio acetiphilus DSM 12809]